MSLKYTILAAPVLFTVGLNCPLPESYAVPGVDKVEKTMTHLGINAPFYYAGGALLAGALVAPLIHRRKRKSLDEQIQLELPFTDDIQLKNDSMQRMWEELYGCSEHENN